MLSNYSHKQSNSKSFLEQPKKQIPNFSAGQIIIFTETGSMMPNL